MFGLLRLLRELLRDVDAMRSPAERPSEPAHQPKPLSPSPHDVEPPTAGAAEPLK